MTKIYRGDTKEKDKKRPLSKLIFELLASHFVQEMHKTINCIFQAVPVIYTHIYCIECGYCQMRKYDMDIWLSIFLYSDYVLFSTDKESPKIIQTFFRYFKHQLNMSAESLTALAIECRAFDENDRRDVETTYTNLKMNKLLKLLIRKEKKFCTLIIQTLNKQNRSIADKLANCVSYLVKYASF